MKNKSNKKFELDYNKLSNKEKLKRISLISFICALITIYNLITSKGILGVVASCFGLIFIIAIFVGSYFNINKNK